MEYGIWNMEEAFYRSLRHAPAATSFTMTPIVRLWEDDSNTYWRVEVLPLPKKPLRRVTGIAALAFREEDDNGCRSVEESDRARMNAVLNATAAVGRVKSNMAIVLCIKVLRFLLVAEKQSAKFVESYSNNILTL